MTDEEALEEYRRDPVGHCIRALDDPNDMVRFQAAEILRVLAGCKGGVDLAVGLD